MKFLKFTLLIFLLGCAQSGPQGPNREVLLKNMPVNSNLRCVGLSAVVELLLEAQYSKEIVQGNSKSFSESVYQNLFEKKKLSIPQNIEVKNRILPIHSKEAIDYLGTLTTNIYKKEFYKAWNTPEGKKVIKSQQKFYLKSLKDVIAILKKDPDQMDVFMGTGKRTFDDGHVKVTHHAFILGMNKEGQLIVRDFNDPRSSWKCEVKDTDHGITVGWRCRYRNTGQTTSQYYYLVSKETYFSKILSKPQK